MDEGKGKGKGKGQKEEAFSGRRGCLSSWVSAEHWKERIVTFNAAWFLVSMGTGAVAQVLYTFPYPAQWLSNLGYCFWILCIILLSFFSTLGVAKSIMFPDLSKETFRDFSQVAYLGAFIISFDNAIVGIVLYYSHHLPALWTAFALYWVAVALTIIVSFAAVPISCCYQQPHAISEVSGVWLLAFVPLIVTSAVGSTLVPHLPSTPSQLTLTVSFLSWSLGQAICSIILCIYLWRLLTASLPSRDLIISGFVPMGPTGEGAFSIQNLSTGLGNHIEKKSYALPIGELPRTRVSMTAVAEGINWLGVFIALCLVALATFWMAQAALSVILRVPKRFNVGFWSCVFPFAVYTNALSRLAQDLNNSGFRGWAATCAVVTTLLWLICALATFWQGVVKGQPFFAPGKEGWQEKGALKERLKAGSGSDVEA